MIEHAGGIIEDQSIDLADADNDLERVTKRMGGRDECGDNEAERSPCELFISLADMGKGGEVTAVTVSMQRTKGSEVRYLLSERAYSFQSCPKRSCAGPIRV